MPDDRLIHGACGHSTKVNLLTDFERLVWLGYKLAADDFGVMRYSAIPLQAKCRWLEQRRAQQVFQALKRVQDVGLIGTFDHQGETFCFDPVWQTWQKITHPRQTIQPAPPLDALDLNTRWLFEHHPKGGKLRSWQAAAKQPDKTGSRPEENREDTGSSPGKKPEPAGPVLVDVGSVGVGVRVSDGAALAPRHGTGSIHRSGHHKHEWCSERICVPEFIHARLSRQLGRPDAETWLKDWYARVVEHTSSPIGEKPEDFWPREFAAEFPPQGRGVSKLTAALEKAGDW